MAAKPSKDPSKENISITFRTEQGKREALDRLADAMDRDRSYVLNMALDYYLDLHEWQLRQIQKGLAAADADEFMSEDEIQAAIRKWQ